MDPMAPQVHQVEVARRLADDVRRVRSEAERLEVSTDSPDGLIRATVGGHGQVIELHLDPRVFRDPDSVALADAITETIQQAQRGVDQEISRLSRSIRRT